MKRIWMSALLLLTALFAARAQAETVYDRGTMYGVMTVYEQPDSLSDVRMVYFSGTPVEVLESVEDGAGQVFTHVCVANQLEGYVLTAEPAAASSSVPSSLFIPTAPPELRLLSLPAGK